MSYERFAYLYDQLMQDVPYDEWVRMVEAYKEKFHIDGMKLLDLACGTGELSVRFAQKGYDVTGADLSPDMLSVAQSKAQGLSLPIQFFQQDMTELEDLGEYDFVGIFCDSLNYLEDEQAVQKTFEGVYRLLKKGGLFLFDVHSVYKMDYIFADATFTWDDEEITYIWNSFKGEKQHSVEHELTFFVLDESGKYDRVDELHFQRTYPIDVYQKLLEQSGFKQIEITGDYKMEAPGQNAERIFFAMRKE
ncbi:class I SAM-dependent DNA methyltransferase [Mesobacillus subterraneus]|uniref:Class I SAM-dependent methyltransferase n=1 Tax=Mesobacillus subterraneus TaxID=285983 RepID=A0A3R9FTH4_9BACI|nr:class I SAM-dependent methyltransferase [Mesobacillus subterraneus]RSD24140.1 class I SAM-dependent methyltransferase [Mesobacillus subterraneus]